jgi:hypothetical protein
MPTGVLASCVCARKNPKSSNNIIDAIVGSVADVEVDVVVQKKIGFFIKVLAISDNSDFLIFNFFLVATTFVPVTVSERQ